MSKTHATGSRAFGFCDRTGFRYPLSELREQYVNRKPSGLMVGKDMLDIDHEQLRLGDVEASDPQSLTNPRPDRELEVSRAMTSWNPVGYGIPDMLGLVGTVTVRID